MSGHELDELIGGDRRLRAAHEALLAAGPPPELPPSLEHAPGSAPSPRVRLMPRRRLGAALVLAAAFALALFGAGYLVSARTGPDAGFHEDFALTMQGTAGGARRDRDAPASASSTRRATGRWR